MKSREIGRTGLHVTPLGLGGAPFGNLFAPIAETDARGTVETAWSKGCRYLRYRPLLRLRAQRAARGRCAARAQAG